MPNQPFPTLTHFHWNKKFRTLRKKQIKQNRMKYTKHIGKHSTEVENYMYKKEQTYIYRHKSIYNAFKNG